MTCRCPRRWPRTQELVNFKKACLRLFHDAQKLEKDLQRYETSPSPSPNPNPSPNPSHDPSLSPSPSPSPNPRHEMFFFRDRDCDEWVEDGSVDPLYEQARRPDPGPSPQP